MQTDLYGLTTGEAAARLAAEGPNELPRVGQRRLPRILRDVLTEPMFALLIGSGVTYLLLGDALEALLLLLFASLSVGIAVMQEARSERMLDALGTSPARVRWSSATASAGVLPAAKWCAAISWCCPKETVCLPTAR